MNWIDIIGPPLLALFLILSGLVAVKLLSMAVLKWSNRKASNERR